MTPMITAEPAAEDGRDPTYFSYYAQFVHQQNMLQDSVRTSLYQTAILSNKGLFQGKVVLDLGAGSGILSYFAVKAGAERVYAVEASGMADRIQKLMDSTNTTNQWLRGKVVVVKGKIEDIKQLELVDTLVSEPIGVLLVHERMIESYIVARDRFLKPGGAMVPSMGTIYVAPFSDANLWTQTMQKVRFWEQQDFHGIDLSPLARDAKEEVFGQPIVGGFDPRSLLSPASPYIVDFRTITQQELQDITIPFTWVAQYTGTYNIKQGLIHGIGAWFDINLGGYILSTSPHAEKTHWHQVRLVLKVRGVMRMKANAMRSYDITAELVGGNQSLLTDASLDFEHLFDTRSLNDGFTRRTGKWALHEQTYYFDSYGTDAANLEANGLYEAESSGSAISGLFNDPDE